MIISDLSKPGYQTTEFWLTLASTVLGAVVAVTPQLGHYVSAVGAFSATVSPIVYSVLRTLGKAHAATLVSEAAGVLSEVAAKVPTKY